MRILQIVPTYLPATRYGGPIVSVHNLSRALAARGNAVHVFTTNLDGANKFPVAADLVEIDGVRVTYFNSMLRRVSWAPELARALRNDVRGFDVVHLNSVFLWPTWAAARAARLAQVPYVVSPRGMLVKELIERKNRFVKSAWLCTVERSNIEQANAIHATSELEAVELARFGWRLPPVAKIANGVDEPASMMGGPSRDIGRVIAEGPLVLFLGRLSWKKGLERLLSAFARVVGGRLAIVGTDDEGLSAHLMRLAANLGIHDRVFILGRTVIGSDKEYLFSTARVFVLPSYSENFGNTVLEAMRRSVPVIVTAEVGAAELVQRSGSGLVVDGAPEVLGAAISRLLEDEALARVMGEAGKHYALAYCGWDTIAAQMEELYSKLTN